MAVLKLSQITAAGANLASADFIVAVQGGTTDVLFTSAQIFAFANLVFASDILEQRRTTNAQCFRVYNTFTDASNYERGVFDWKTTSNVLQIGVEALGTGAQRNVKFLSGAKFAFFANTSGNTDVLLGTNLDTNGVAGVKGSRDSVFGWTSGGGDATSANDTGISRAAAGVIAIGNGSAAGDTSGTIKALSKAGAITTGDVPNGTWIVARDTSGATTKLYYNNAGSLMVVALV